MNLTSRALRASLLVIGLSLASCGGQADSGSESVATTTSIAANSGPAELALTDEEVVEDDLAGAGASVAAVPAATEDAALELSALASQVTSLPSAFPERVLEGLGDPIGVMPQTISLPDVGVDSATILPVGLEPNGELEVPGADEVGWYQFGAGVDGGKGSTVLAAHIAYNGRDGVFRNLADSNVGEQITVGRDGEQIEYRIESVTQYNKFELPIGDLFAEDGREQLVLITCGGSFNPSVRSYDDNVVVVAVPIAV